MMRDVAGASDEESARYYTGTPNSYTGTPNSYTGTPNSYTGTPNSYTGTPNSVQVTAQVTTKLFPETAF
jgi:hypothetical protein